MTENEFRKLHFTYLKAIFIGIICIFKLLIASYQKDISAIQEIESLFTLTIDSTKILDKSVNIL